MRIGIYTIQNYPHDRGVTAPWGAGCVRRISPRRSLRNVDDDHTVFGDDRKTKTVATAFSDDHEDPFTSCRDGPAYAVEW